jgi:2-dehydropantoate 2-reductase
MKRTDILVVGTGAVGSYFGGKLAQVETRVSALCRSDFEIAQKKGLEIQSYKGDFVFKPAEVVKEVTQLSIAPDYIIVCLKVLPEINVAEIIKSAVGPETVIVLIQNGINVEKTVAEAFPDNELISGIAFIAISRLKLGIAKHTGSGKLILGNYPHGVSEKTKQLAGFWSNAGVPCDLSEKVSRDRWQKMVWNAAFNPISVLGGRADSLQMVEVPESESLVRKVMEEVLSLAKATGNDLPEKIMDSIISGNRKMKPFKTSMLVDYEMNRSMEVDAILGNAIAIAREKNMSVPYLESLYSLLKLQVAVSKERGITK